jgi:hypothetical protein
MIPVVHIIMTYARSTVSVEKRLRNLRMDGWEFYKCGDWMQTKKTKEAKITNDNE